MIIWDPTFWSGFQTVQRVNFLVSNLLKKIWIPDTFGIQIPTVEVNCVLAEHFKSKIKVNKWFFEYNSVIFYQNLLLLFEKVIRKSFKGYLSVLGSYLASLKQMQAKGHMQSTKYDEWTFRVFAVALQREAF